MGMRHSYVHFPKKRSHLRDGCHPSNRSHTGAASTEDPKRRRGSIARMDHCYGCLHLCRKDVGAGLIQVVAAAARRDRRLARRPRDHPFRFRRSMIIIYTFCTRPSRDMLVPRRRPPSSSSTARSRCAVERDPRVEGCLRSAPQQRTSPSWGARSRTPGALSEAVLRPVAASLSPQFLQRSRAAAGPPAYRDNTPAFCGGGRRRAVSEAKAAAGFAAGRGAPNADERHARRGSRSASPYCTLKCSVRANQRSGI
jgi:hypothetical protein